MSPARKRRARRARAQTTIDVPLILRGGVVAQAVKTVNTLFVGFLTAEECEEASKILYRTWKL